MKRWLTPSRSRRSDDIGFASDAANRKPEERLAIGMMLGNYEMAFEDGRWRQRTLKLWILLLPFGLSSKTHGSTFVFCSAVTDEATASGRTIRELEMQVADLKVSLLSERCSLHLHQSYDLNSFESFPLSAPTQSGSR